MLLDTILRAFSGGTDQPLSQTLHRCTYVLEQELRSRLQAQDETARRLRAGLKRRSNKVSHTVTIAVKIGAPGSIAKIWLSPATDNGTDRALKHLLRCASLPPEAPRLMVLPVRMDLNFPDDVCSQASLCEQ